MDKVNYVTLVRLVCMVEGKRTEIPPGKPVPPLPDVTINELLASKSIERTDAAAIEKRQELLAGAETQDEFQAERDRLRSERSANADAAKPSTPPAGAGTSGAGESGKGGSKK